MVIIFSVAGGSGRLLVGFAADRLADRISRPGLIAIVVSVMSLAQLLLAFSTYDMLYVATVLVGASFGSFWTLFPAATADMFGMHSFGAICAWHGRARFYLYVGQFMRGAPARGRCPCGL